MNKPRFHLIFVIADVIADVIGTLALALTRPDHIADAGKKVDLRAAQSFCQKWQPPDCARTTIEGRVDSGQVGLRAKYGLAVPVQERRPPQWMAPMEWR